MASVNEDRARQVVPRLRLFESAVRTGEVESLAPLADNPFTDQMLQNTLDDWNAEPTVAVAADLVSVAITLGRPHVAREAAEFVLRAKNAPVVARNLAGVCADGDTSLRAAHERSTLPPLAGLILED